ncbi:protein kinase domain-containing protein [Bythopirellula polymerisocia]|uniref:Serine/threonine-protein kinase PrkC n=1 Tax=Bythopirellula polymerisocia TaxID=2528003 RepID=A0A5C6CQF3_9BACT|nr:protein kinase [Bythopirellula polymerisocia]TWU25847.1 Serine/threonine-protein kinase PrkC [Bythopirellula polymerisocia]
MVTDQTAEKLAQRALDVNIVTQEELRGVWNVLGTQDLDYEQFKQLLVRQGLLTNFQLERLEQGYRTGFVYGDYKVLYLVGAGTFARVYRAAHRVTNELFALKVLRKSKSEIPAESDLFRREGELGMQLKHPNIVAIHEVFSKGKIHYIVMDFVEGHNLRDFFRVRGKFEPLEAARIVEGLVSGLSYAFQRGITHRDLKMSNVIVSSDGVAKLVDFGLAGLGGDEGGEAVNPRTIDYAGLERATNVRKDDLRSDIFFAGCIFYQLMCGQSPMSENRDRTKRLDKSRFLHIRPISEIDPNLPLALVRVVNKAMELIPERRYQTPGEMLADLKLASKRVRENRDLPVAELDIGPQEGHDANGQPRKVMIVESDTKMQNVFRELFKKQGYRVLVTSDPDRLFQRFYEDSNFADVVLLSSGHIGRSAVEAFNRFSEESSTKNTPVVLLLGDKQKSLQKQAKPDERRVVVQMPVKSKELRQAILQLLPTVSL